MNSTELLSLIDQAGSGELQGFEYKHPLPWEDQRFKLKIVKSMMAMANTRYGGTIAIGVDEQADGAPKASGLSPEDLATWKKDDIAAFARKYWDPDVEFVLDKQILVGHSVVTISVEEFSTVPILCSQDAHGPDNDQILKNGAIYIRPLGKPESRAVLSHAELREVLDIATEKALKHYLTVTERAGGKIISKNLRFLSAIWRRF